MVECPSRPHRSLSHQGRSAIRGGPIYFCAPLRTPQQLALPLQRRGRVQSGTSRMWTLALGSMSTPAHGYEATRGAAMAAEGVKGVGRPADRPLVCRYLRRRQRSDNYRGDNTTMRCAPSRYAPYLNCALGIASERPRLLCSNMRLCCCCYGGPLVRKSTSITRSPSGKDCMTMIALRT